MHTSDDDAYYQVLFWKTQYDAREVSPWPELQKAAETTTNVVRDLVQSIIANQGHIGGSELQTLFHLCQNPNDGPSIEDRRKLVKDLDLPAEDIERITQKIERPMGSVGSAMHNPALEVGDPDQDNTEDAKRRLHDCFARLINNLDPVNESELIAAVEDLVTIDFKRVQSGRMSPILHYLAPKVFPIVNGQSSKGMELCFDVHISRQLEDYLDERETYLTVRDEFQFKPQFRDLDWFFNWVNQDGNPWTVVAHQDEKRQYWQAQPGTRDKDYPDVLWPRWQKENIISAGHGFGPVSSFDSPSGLKGQGGHIVHRMSPGDIVVAKAGHTNFLGIGVVTPEGYEYRTTEDEWIEFSNHGESNTHQDIRFVKWMFTVSVDDAIDISGWEMGKQFDNNTVAEYENFHELRHKLFDQRGDEVLDELEEIEQISASFLSESNPDPRDVPEKNEPDPKEKHETILALEDTSSDASQEALDSLKQKLTSPQVDVTVPDALYFDDEDRLRREIEASLHSGKHIILTGPPGTGKTKLAKAICETAKTHEQVDGYRFTTATSEWTAFDTIGGYVPSTSGDGQELHFEPRLFLKCFRQDSVVNQWLIIDEINRSDIDKAFGQLFSVLSGDSTELPYERDRTVELVSVSDQATEGDLIDILSNPDAFPVTPSWRLIATMNTYDKTSLYEMSYAFMRRFNFIHVGVPSLTTDDGDVRTSLLNPNDPNNYAKVWLDENPELRPVLESSYDVIGVLWQHINQHRVIGPSIVYDMLRYLHSYDNMNNDHSDALTSAVISLVYPQLEGMRPERQKRLIRSLTETGISTQNGNVDLPLDGSVLQAKAADFFGITFDDDA